jgi:WD40 repeat protein
VESISKEAWSKIRNYGILFAVLALAPGAPGAGAALAERAPSGPHEWRSKLVLSVAFSADGEWLAATSKGSPYYVWDIATGAATVQTDRRGWEGAPGALALSPHGNLLAAGVVPAFWSFPKFHTPIVRVWNLRAHRTLWEYGEGGPLSGASSSTLSFSPDAKSLAAGLFYETPAFSAEHLELLNAKTGTVLFGFARNVKGVASARFSPQGQIAATPVHLFGKRNPALWEVGAHEPARTYRGCSHVDLLAFGPAGTQLAGGGGKRICVWSVRSGKMLRSAAAPQARLVGLALQSNGLLELALAGSGVSVSETDRPAVTERCALPALVAPAEFSPDGRLLAWGDKQLRAVHLWDVESCKEIRSFAMKSNRSRHRAGRPR